MANYLGRSRAGQYMAGPGGLLIRLINAPDNLTQLNHQGIHYDLEVSERFADNALVRVVDASHIPFSRDSWAVHPSVTADLDAPFEHHTRLTTQVAGRTNFQYEEPMPRPLFDQRQLRQRQESLAEYDRIRAARLRAAAPAANIQENPAIQNAAPVTPEQVTPQETTAPTGATRPTGYINMRIGDHDYIGNIDAWSQQNEFLRDRERSLIESMRAEQRRVMADAYFHQERLDTERSRRVASMLTTPQGDSFTWHRNIAQVDQPHTTGDWLHPGSFITAIDPYQDLPAVDGHEVHTLTEVGVQMQNPLTYQHMERVFRKHFSPIATEPLEPEVKETDPKFVAKFQEEDPF
jgi:hypothetical protein